MKIIAFYLPQFHEIPENNNWWGKGFTEWTNVKKARKLFKNHYQPRVPLDNNYYNLLNKKVMRWQANLAKKYGVYGFCFYHYWFDGHMLLEKPMEILLNNKDIDINYCVSWANEDWTNSWVSSSNKILISQTYGSEKDWIDHFNYLLQFFKDPRYIKENNMPLLVIYRPELISCLNKMLDCWNKLSIKHGFNGIKFAYQHYYYGTMDNKDDSKFSYQIEYQPSYGFLQNNLTISKISKIKSFISSNFGYDINLSFFKKIIGPKKYNYNDIWEKIIQTEPYSSKSIPGAFVDWDNTPRRSKSGSLVIGANPTDFGQYLKKQIIRAKEIYQKDYIFIFAWNEWAEGGYLEPDEKYKYSYLNEIYRALLETNELPKERERK